MGPVVKKEVYTAQQPDGTLVTTTTKTEYKNSYEYTATAINVDYCCTPAAFLRVAQIICGFVIVGCVSAVGGTSFRDIFHGHTFVLILTCLCICITFLFLVIFFLGMHSTHLQELPWREMDLFYSIIAVILFLVAGGLEAYYASGSWSRLCRQQLPENPFYSSCHVIVPWAVASAFCFLNAILYAIGALLAWRKKYYL